MVVVIYFLTDRFLNGKFLDYGYKAIISAALAAVDSRGSKNFSAVLPGFDSRQES